MGLTESTLTECIKPLRCRMPAPTGSSHGLCLYMSNAQFIIIVTIIITGILSKHIIIDNNDDYY